MATGSSTAEENASIELGANSVGDDELGLGEEGCVEGTLSVDVKEFDEVGKTVSEVVVKATIEEGAIITDDERKSITWKGSLCEDYPIHCIYM